MIVFFGPAGAGKSMQGQILAARHGWRWLSTGQMLRDSKDAELLEQMSRGNLVSDEIVNRVVVEGLTHAQEVGGVILDGYPRNVEQAKHLFDTKSIHGQAIDVAVVLDVPREEIIQRLQLRGRADDTAEAIGRRLDIYQAEIQPILDLLEQEGIPVIRAVGTGTVGQIHDAIEHELVTHGVVEGL